MADHIGNRRYVVRGVREGDGRKAPIFATDDHDEAERVLREGRTVDGRRWRGASIHDRRTDGLMPVGGWFM